MRIAIVLLAACSHGGPAAPAAVEETGLIHHGDKQLTLLGPTLDVGAPMPDVTLADGKLEPIKLSSLKGKVIVLSVVPSIDTPVCESQTHHMSAAMDQMPKGVEVFTVSRDLPFAQSRFAQEAVVNTKMASDYHGGDFGKAFGLEVKETGLLGRSVWIIGPDGKIAYRQIVSEQGMEPNLDEVVAAVKKLSSPG
jgi:thiol peroxidase